MTQVRAGRRVTTDVNDPRRMRDQIEAATAGGKTINARTARQIIVDARRGGGITDAEREELRDAYRENLDAFEPAAQRVMFMDAGIPVPVSQLEGPKLPRSARDSSYRKPYAQLVRHGVNYRDVIQGSLGDCYFLATLSAIAKEDPGALQKNFKANPDGSITFTFYKRERNTAGRKGGLVPVDVVVDRRVVMSRGQATLAHISRGNYGMPELWVALYEKAYAQFRGGYHRVGRGGFGEQALEAITGQEADTRQVDSSNEADIGPHIARALSEKKAVVAGSRGRIPGGASTGIVANHEYSLLGYRRDEHGTEWVQLRNPWGDTEPGEDGKNDGIFWMRVSSFAKCFSEVSAVSFSRD